MTAQERLCQRMLQAEDCLIKTDVIYTIRPIRNRWYNMEIIEPLGRKT
jgi:hypothetical protein